MRRLFLIVVSFLLVSQVYSSRTTVTILPDVRYQVMRGFGASDAWNAQYVGKYWDAGIKADVAKKLFSRTFDGSGNPTGIGLSRWRFNIGAGSQEQGDSSNISAVERRVECFLKPDGTYDWTKQSGQQWFLEQSKAYGVEQRVAFVNSPPRYFTLNKRTNSDNTNNFGPTNLRSDCYDDFTRFLVEVLSHFEQRGLGFHQISPVNEPQYKWDEGQEGCPYKNTDIKQLAVQLDKALQDSGLSTRILLAEASDYNDLHQSDGNADKCDQIWKFFSPSRTEYLGNLTQMLPGLAAHSYYTDGDDATIRSVRTNVAREAREQGNIELFMTEYNLLSTDYDDYTTNAVFLAKMIYADLAIAGVSIWDYWTAMERERYSQKNRFYLMRLRPYAGDYADLTGKGYATADKNLWSLGNYSLFIRPGYQRIGLTGADNLAGLMGTAFLAPDTSRLCAVYVNWNTAADTLTQLISEVPAGFRIARRTAYVTNASYNLQPRVTAPDSIRYILPARSVTTVVLSLERINSAVEASFLLPEFSVVPGASEGLYKIRQKGGGNQPATVCVYNLSGRVVQKNQVQNDTWVELDLKSQPSGLYLIRSGEGLVKVMR